MEIRRVVTAKDAAGKSTIERDGASPRATRLQHTPRFVTSPLWSTSENPSVVHDHSDPMNNLTNLVPGPGETRFMVVTFPPDSVMASPDFDPALARLERLQAAPGLAETFETDNPGMHTTPTIDYGVVMDGEIWLELDDNKTVHLKEHDVFVQYGVRHAWRNKANRSATVAFVLIGAKVN